MATFAFSTMAFPQGATFVFGSWVYFAKISGGLESHLANPTEPKMISSKSCNAIAASDDHGDMLSVFTTKPAQGYT